MSLKNLANSTLSRLGKRDTLRDKGGTPLPEGWDTGGTPPPNPAENCQKSEAAEIGQFWDAETAELIAWFEAVLPPAEPFQMRPGITITDPTKFWDYMRRDVAAGPGKARAYTGAFQADLRRLHGLFDQRSEAA